MNKVLVMALWLVLAVIGRLWAQNPVTDKIVPNSQNDWKLQEVQTARNAAYLTEREKEMLEEINMVRTNPQAYIKYIRDYEHIVRTKVIYPKAHSITTTIEIADGKETTRHDTIWHGEIRKRELRAIEEVIKELEVLKPLAALKPHPELFKVSQYRAQEVRNRGYLFDHKEIDPQQRILIDMKIALCAGENLAEGPKTLRYALIALLADAGHPQRIHRYMILNPHWEYAICHEIGKVDRFPDCWVQHFAGTKPCPKK